MRAQIERKLTLIRELDYEGYFPSRCMTGPLRQEPIHPLPRASVANLAVCFAIDITEVDPMRVSMLMERFICTERNESPDIDIEHERS